MLNQNELADMVRFLTATGHPALVDEQGSRIDLPKPVYRQLLRVLKMMEAGRAVVMMPEEETFTSQAAANYLGVSRQHLVNLMEHGKIPFHKVGTHRRVYFKDLLEYDRKRNSARREGLDKLTKEIDEAALYEADYTGND